MKFDISYLDPRSVVVEQREVYGVRLVCAAALRSGRHSEFVMNVFSYRRAGKSFFRAGPRVSRPQNESTVGRFIINIVYYY